jgi:hypothetical protein
MLKLGIKIQQRDIAILQEIGRSRFLTYQQLAEICFCGRTEAAKKRALKLRTAGLLNTFQLSFGSPACLLLTKRGAKCLKERGVELPKFSLQPPGLATFRHETALRDIKSAWYRRERMGELRIEEFSLDSHDLEFSTSHGSVRPDGYVRICRPTELTKLHFFIELDRGTESLDRLDWRVAQYWHFYKAGGFAIRMGQNAEEFKRLPFRVILLLESRARMMNMSQVLLGKGFKSFVCLALASDFCDFQNNVEVLTLLNPVSAFANSA